MKSRTRTRARRWRFEDGGWGSGLRGERLRDVMHLNGVDLGLGLSLLGTCEVLRA
jgi:predicted TPR repeat methyltransferase